MPLVKQVIDLTFGVGGLNQKLDEKVLEAPHLHVLEDGEINKSGAIALRPGYWCNPANTTGPCVTSSACTAHRLGVRENKIVMLREEPAQIAEYQAAVTYDYSATDWSVKDVERHARSSEKIIYSSTAYMPSMIDSAIFGNYLVVVCTLSKMWDPTVHVPSGIRLLVFNLETLGLLYEVDVAPETEALHSLCKGKLIVVGSKLLVFYTYYSGGESGVTNLRAREYDPATNTLSDYTVVDRIVAGAPWFDIATDGTRIFAICHNYVASFPYVYTLSSALITLYSAALDDDGATYEGDTHGAVAIGVDVGGHVYCVYQTVNGIYVTALPTYQLASITWHTQLFSPGAGKIVMERATLSSNGTSGAFIAIEFESAELHPPDRIVAAVLVDYSTGYPTIYGDYFWVRLLHRARSGTYYNGINYNQFVGLVGPDTSEATNYTVQLNVREAQESGDYILEANPIAQFQTRVGWDEGEIPYSLVCDSVTSFNQRETKRYWWVTSIKVSTAGVTQAAIVLNEVDLRTDQGLVQPSRERRNMLMAASMPTAWDGSGINEIGMCQSPVICDHAVVAHEGPFPTGIEMSTTYTYIAVYERRDAFGNLYRSRPSLPYAITVDETAYPTIQVRIRTYIGYRYGLDDRHTYLTPRENKYRWRPVLYRLSPTDGLYHRVAPYLDNSVISWYGNITGHADSYTQIEDYASTALIDTGEYLYTSGGVLEDYASPPSSFFAVHQNRVWAINSANGDIWWSKTIEEAAGPAFNVAWYIKNMLHDNPVALVSMNESALVVIWEHRIGVIYGEGPNNLGQGGSYTTPQMLSTDTGCINWRSVIKTQLGIFYQSAKGFCLLPSDLSTPQYIGAAVDDYRAQTVLAVSLIEDEHQLRYVVTSLTSGVDILVYDYLVNIWAVWQIPNMSANPYRDAIECNGEHALLHTRGLSVMHGSTDYPADIAYGITPHPPALRVVTPWIKTAGLQGFQRVWRAVILGAPLTWLGGVASPAHQLTVNMYYDYNYATYDTVSIPWTYLGTLYNYSIPLTIIDQRCEAIKIEIISEQREVGGVYSGVPALTGLRLEYGVLPGSVRLPGGY